MKQLLKGFTIEVMRLFTMIVYPDVWKLYEKVHGMGKKNGFIHNLLLETYEKRLFVYGGAVGLDVELVLKVKTIFLMVFPVYLFLRKQL